MQTISAHTRVSDIVRQVLLKVMSWIIFEDTV